MTRCTPGELDKMAILPTRNRLWRRAHKLRQARRVRRRWSLWRLAGTEPQIIDLLCLKLADNRKPCSCYMCENPRKRGELPIQERRERDAERLDEISVSREALVSRWIQIAREVERRETVRKAKTP